MYTLINSYTINPPHNTTCLPCSLNEGQPLYQAGTGQWLCGPTGKPYEEECRHPSKKVM